LPIDDPSECLKRLLVKADCRPLQTEQIRQFIDYLSLILRWNVRTNLTAVREAEGILERHFVESIACAQALPEGISTLLDYGSGAGFPGIPIAICRPEIAVTLAESQNKKAAFLQEALRVTGLAARVHSGRAENLTIRFDCATLRAVEEMDVAVRSAACLVGPGGWVAVMTTSAEISKVQTTVGSLLSWAHSVPLPCSEQRVLALGQYMGLPS